MKQNQFIKTLRFLTLIAVIVCFRAAAQAQEAYAVYTNDGTLTFYYDNQKSSRSGTKYSLNTGTNEPGWYTDHRQDIKKAVFTSSFSGARPTSTFSWFCWCSNLTSITGMENLNTVNVTNMMLMFYHCSSLTSLDVSKFNTANVTSMNSIFGSCYNLASLDLSNFNTANVTDMGFMFSDCDELTSLDVSNFNTANVTNMHGMFYDCSSLTSLDLSNFNTEKVTNMSTMFGGCTSLTSLDVSNFNTANVTDMGAGGHYLGMFGACFSLTSLDVSNFNTAKVTNMDGMFYDCSSLTSLDLSNFNTENVTDMHGMFYDCSSLTSLDLSNFNTENVTDMSWMFPDCSSLTSLDVSNFNTANVTNMSGMFWGCSKLTSLDVSNFNTANVTRLNGMFDECSSLTSLDVSHFNTEKVTNMMQMFNNCSSLTNLDLSNFNTENVTSMGGMFSRCSSLASLDLSNFNTANVIEITSMFWGCTSLITIYADETKWSTAKVASYNYEEGSGVFINCNNLIGGNGTVFDAYHTDYEYARIDKPGQPGYLTDKNAEAEELCDADDLLRFIENLSGNTTTNDNPAEATLCDEPTIDQDVDIEDDLWLYLYGDDNATPPVMNFYGGAINLKSRNSGWTFKGVGFTCKNEATAPMRAAEGLGGITSVGTLTFDGCTMKEGNYTIQNLSDGRMYLSGGTMVEGYGNLVNNGNAYIDGSVKVADLVNKKGGRIYVTSALTKDLKVSIATTADVEQGVAIILGGNGYTMTAADVSHITLTLPDGYEWKYNETVGGIVVSTASGITAPHSTHPVAVDSYTIKGHKVPASHQGITIQRMSDGTVVKIYSPK